MVLCVGDARNTPLPDDSVDLIVTSPPYWSLRDYGIAGEIGGEIDPDEYIRSLRLVLAEMHRVLKTDGNVFIVIGDKYARTGGVDKKVRGRGVDPGGRRHTRPVQRGVPGVPDGSLVGLPYRLALAAISDGWLWRQDIVWAKPNPLPESVRRRCVRSHETILHLTKTAQHYVRRAAEHGGACGHDVWTVRTQGYRDPGGLSTPAVYPEELVETILHQWCPPDGMVFDPFVGSGTSAIVAIRNGHRFTGMDLNAEMIDVTYRRLVTNNRRST